ncbi:hypothetical protein XENOCAPTIV_020996 [Xenoophorus captivus]|uniref:Uncharacterized protein n=1 Tax=Xenoophorus captivus TaxID=1517983 RepID=A0ABV0RB58_9TELE
MARIKLITDWQTWSGNMNMNGLNREAIKQFNQRKFLMNINQNPLWTEYKNNKKGHLRKELKHHLQNNEQKQDPNHKLKNIIRNREKKPKTKTRTPSNHDSLSNLGTHTL